MQFKVYAPAKQLSSYIHTYLEGDCSDTAGEYTMFPNGFSGIFFNFGNTGTLIIKEKITTPAVSIYGQIDRYFTITHPPGFYSIGALFKPSALSKLLRLDMTELTNTALDGKLVNRSFKELHARMEETPDVNSKITLLNMFFTHAFSMAPSSTGVADHALRVMELYRNIPMENLAQEVGVSQRYLERQFNKAVGLSPKTFSLIQRFKRIENELRVSSSAYWADLRFANNYYDQNHFIKDFKRFTGLTPSVYLLENFETAKSYLVK